MTTLKKYQVYCNDEATYYNIWDDSVPTVCPNNAAHTINTNTIMIVDQVNTNPSIVQAKNFKDDDYQDLHLDSLNNLNISMQNPLSSFGQIAVDNLVPTIQVDGDYGFLESDIIKTEKGGSYTSTANNNSFVVNTGVTSGYADVQTLRRHRYRPGQGSVAMFTSIFDQGVTGCTMLAGVTTEFSGFYVGYNEDKFGVLHENDGRFEVQRLTLDSGVTSGNSTLNLVLNSVQYDIDLTANKTVEYNAWEIQEYFKTEQSWNGYANENIVNILADFSQTRSGTYSTSHGTLDQIMAGQSKTKNWTYQEDWVFDKLDGTGSSGMILDPTKGNVYKLQIQYLGYGNTKLYIENENTGAFNLVHTLRWSNKNTSTVYTNPSFRPKISCSNDGNCNVNKTITSPCLTMFNEGEIKYKRNSRAFSITKIGVGTDMINIISFRVSSLFRNNVNTNELIPLFVSISNTASQNSNTTISLAIDYDFDTFQNYKYIDSNNSIVEYTTDSTIVANTNDMNIISTYNLGDSNSYTIQLNNNISVEANQVLSIFAKTNIATAELSVSMTWVED